MLFHGRRGAVLPQLLQVRSDVNRLDLAQFAQPPFLAPGQKGFENGLIGFAGMVIAQLCRKEFERAFACWCDGGKERSKRELWLTGENETASL